MKLIEPSVERIDTETSRDKLARIFAGYRVCYSADTVPVVAEPSEMEDFVRRMLSASRPHESPLEHAAFTFFVTCSRSCSHQFVRHRIASFSQQSQRYVKFSDVRIILPKNITENAVVMPWFAQHMEKVEKAYTRMLARNIPPEDARAILPNCAATQLVVSMNCRELLHFFDERCCFRAQGEIRGLAESMLAQCREAMPAVFENAGMPCLKSKKCVQLKPCGQRPWEATS